MFLRALLFTTILFCCTVAGAFFYILEDNWVDVSAFQRRVKVRPSIILDDQGNEFARFSRDKRDPVTFDQLPDVVVKAFLAAEDHNFFTHYGISLRGIVRTMLVNLYHWRRVQGASTITQQVARLLFLTQKREWSRKIQEAFLAIQLERQLSKEQIFELYLNNIYFGRGTYGIQAACKRFWNKDVHDVTLDEAAVLAAVAKSARFYSPLNAPLTAKKRRNIILRSMRNLKFITEEQRQVAYEKPLTIKDFIPGGPMRLYIQEWVRAWAEHKWGKDALYDKGLKIKITINPEMQKQAEKSFSEVVYKMREKQKQDVNGGMVTMEVSSGKVRSLIGGIDFCSSQFNRAFQASRQLGSSFKPLMFALALKSGFDMDDVFVDEPLEFNQPDGTVWKPRNWHRSFEGEMTLLRALTRSNNIISVKLLLKLGAHRVAQWLEKFGITRDIKPYPSLALGTAHGTPQENAAAFNVFANNGVYVEPYMIEWVKDQWGHKIWTHKPVRRQVLDAKTNSKMVKALTHRMRLTKKRFSRRNWVDCQSIGKTGSTNGAVTAWFVGSTPEYTAAVYLGRDDSKPMGRYVYANTTAFPIWLNLFKTITSKKKHFYYDPDLKEVAVDWFSGDPVYAYHDKNTVKILKE